MLAAYNRSMDIFSMIYYFECILKMTALGCNGYFADAWCQFDFFLVCTSLLDQFASEFLEQYLPIPPMLLRVMRILRILRILRLLKGAKELRDLIVTMVLSFPSLLNVGSLLALIMFIYSVLGVNLFTFVAHGDPISEAHGGINYQRNFDTFNNAFLLLLQCLTGDGWSSVMADAMKDEASGKCVMAEGNCGSPASIPFFITFQVCMAAPFHLTSLYLLTHRTCTYPYLLQVIGSFIFLNLVVAVILENFATLYFTSPDLVSNSDLDVFNEAWTEFDPDATNYIPVGKLPDLLHSIPKPLGTKGRTKVQANRVCLKLNVPQHNGNVAYHEVLKELITNNYRSGADLDEEIFTQTSSGAMVPQLKLKVPKPPLKQGGDDDDLPSAARKQQNIAEVFAMATMFKDEVRAAFARSKARARDRISRGVKGGYHGLSKEQQVHAFTPARPPSHTHTHTHKHTHTHTQARTHAHTHTSSHAI